MDSVLTQRRNLPLLATTENVSGKTYIVTGANTGLGYEAAKHLIELGAAKVIMAVRNVNSGETAKAEIETATGKTNVAEVWAIDLASYASVNAFAEKAISELDRIDGLIENAGIAGHGRVFAEGHLLGNTINVLSTLLLAVLLLPKMSESATKFNTLPHLVIVTSDRGFDCEPEWHNIKDDPLKKMDDEAIPSMKGYPLSKLLEILAVRHLATLIPVSRTGVVVNLVGPGLCKTALSRNAPETFRSQIAVMHEKYGRTAEDGSRTLLHGVVAGKESHGCFLHSCEIGEDVVPAWVTSEEGKKEQKQLWEAIAEELEVAKPGCVKAIL